MSLNLSNLHRFYHKYAELYFLELPAPDQGISKKSRDYQYPMKSGIYSASSRS